MKVFALSGISNTGKTTVAARIIAELRQRGYSVGTVKDSHCVERFHNGADPAIELYLAAGAALYVSVAPLETAFVYPCRLDLADIIGHYDYDILLLEGFSTAELPRIITAATEEDIARKRTELTFGVTGIFAQGGISSYQGLPVIDGLNYTKELCDLILSRLER